jgi:sugar phosphate isomerase/epimerase
MKLSVAIAEVQALPSAFVVWRGLENSIAKAADFGYQGVELALKTADEVDAAALESWLLKKDMEVSCISTGQVFADLGLYFTHPDASVRDKVISVFAGLIELAADFGRLINVGRTRGFIAAGQTAAEAEQLFLETATHICDMADKRSVTIILEPVNRYEINFINSLDEGARLIQKSGISTMGLMPDVFHMNIEDDKIGDSLVRNARWIRYIHLADSNRLAPGWGHIDFAEVFAGLRQADFDGWASIEILPKPDADTAALQAAQYILPLIAAYNIQSKADRRMNDGNS